VHAESLVRFIGPHTNPRILERKLKIGYVSPDFRSHAVASFIEPVLAHHDQERFEIFAYYNHGQNDMVTQRLRKYCHHWRNIAAMSDEEVAELIREDEIDFLIDLAGHTGHNRLLVFARKPAPIQVTWLGYPDTTGLSTMDYRITDGFADPVDMTEDFHTEQLIRLPECFSVYHVPEEYPEVSRLPALENGYITFGSFNNFSKTTPEVIALWAKILRSVPDSRLMLKYSGLSDSSMKRMVREAFARLDIHPSRVELLGKDPSHVTHLQRYYQLDIALDTFPYCGTTTTCEALWMGVPVITLAGSSHVSRVGSSLMSNLGYTEMIASSQQKYVAIAVGLAPDIDRLSAIREELRDRMADSPLMDSTRFTQHLENAYKEMWRTWCMDNGD
jgi:predicted O-linked N-acetylglucosamine transferase (SPINDLY family)